VESSNEKLRMKSIQEASDQNLRKTGDFSDVFPQRNPQICTR